MIKGKKDIFRNLVLLSHIGIMMIIPILGAVYIGNIVDQKLGTGYIFMFIFIIVGVASSFLNVYKIVMKDIKKKK
ncbi:AtpZ/AtpI family protein [Lutibacter sp. B2]|nr:AtpZ/AtpI family protein [Lutibacter sp. B2]